MLLSIFIVGIIFIVQPQSTSPHPLVQTADLLSDLFSRLPSNHDSRRNLQAFSSLNDIFSETTLTLPDSSVSSNGLDLTITDLTCSELSVQDIQVGHTPSSDTTVRLWVNVIGLEVTCDFRWNYKWTIFNGSGSAKAVLDSASWASINLDFVSQDYNEYPPKDVNIDDCTAEIEVGDLEFDGDGLGFIASILNLFESLLSGRVEGEVNTAVCTELKGLGDRALDDILLKVSTNLDGFLEPLPEDIRDPLFLENSLVIPMDENATSLYLNFLELEKYAGDWLNTVFDKLGSFLGGSEANGELGINSFIRDNFLNGDGEFVVNPSDFMDSNVIFESHDMLTETSMSIESIAIGGLDTFTELDMMNAIGNHTLGNSMKLESLSLVVNMKAFMKASSQSDSVISAPNSAPIEEKFSVTVVLNDIDVDFSLLLALNTEALGNLQLGPLLHRENILECIMSAAEEMSFTELSVSVVDVVPPTLTGFLDVGIDKIVSNGAAALFDMYEKVLLKAMPNFFQTFVREKLNAFVEDSLQLLTVCKSETHPLNGFIDFRDLLLDSKLASAEGGSGRSPYGNVLNWVWELVQEELFSPDEFGLLAMNDIFVRPLTKAQSGEEGLLSFNRTLVDLKKDAEMDIWKAFADTLRLSFSNLRLSGLDTFREPFHLIKPSNLSGNVLENHISLGIENKSLEAIVQFDIEVGGPNTSPLATSNTMDLQVSFPSIEILADLFATIDESRFMTMPLKHALNLDCWLSMISNSNVSPIDASERASAHSSGLAVDLFDVLFGGFFAQTSCISCGNKALEGFNEIMDFLDDNDFFANVRSRGIAIVSDIAVSEWMIGVFDSRVEAAALRCPSDPNYGALTSQINGNEASFQASRQIVDGVLYGGMTIVQIIAIVLAQKHSDVEVPVDVDVQLDVPENATLIDFTNLTSIASWVDMVLDEASTYLGSSQQNDDGSQALRIVKILQTLLLDDDGLLTIPILDQGFEAGGVVLSLHNVTLVGLDSFTSFNVLNTTGPQMFRNKAKLEVLGVSVDMGLSVGQDSELETVTASLILKDVELDVSFLLAMDQDILGNLKLGSIMNTKNIFFCILSAIHTVGLSEFVMNIGDIESFSLSGFMTDSTNDSIKNFTRAVFAKYKGLVLESIPAFTSTTVRALLHGIFQVLLKMAKSGQCSDPVADVNNAVDFRDLFLSSTRSIELLGSGDNPYGDLFQVLFNFIEKSTALTNNNGLSMINDALVSKLTEDGNMYWQGELFRRNLDISLNGLNADITLAIKDVHLEHLDSIGSPVRILQPVYGERSILNNSASIGVGPDPLRVAFTLFVSGEGDQIRVNNEVELGLSLSNATLLLELLAKIREISLISFPLRDIMNVNCWLSTVVTPVLDQYGIRVGNKTMSLQNVLLAVAEAQLDMKCISCSSPVLLEMSSYFESTEGVEDTTLVVNMLLEYGSGLLEGDFFQNMVDRLLIEASMKCPHSPTYDQNFNPIKYNNLEAGATTERSYGFLFAILSVILVMILFSAVITLMVKRINRRRHEHWIKQLSRSQVIQLAGEEKYESLRQRDLNLRMKALAFSNDSIPLAVRYGIPIVVLGNIALFLSGHISLGGTVNISGQFAGQQFDVKGFFEFSMAKSTIEMWQAGAHSLAILIVIFSGIWPYTKQFTIFALWFLPPCRVTSKRRGQIMHWLDVLGKWSMVDVFVLLMSIASFRISITSPSHLDFLPEDLFEVQMMVIPLWGLYANMLAQIVSQVSSHVIIHYHRKTVTVATRAQELEWNIESSSQIRSDPVALRNHHFKLDYEASTKYAVVCKWVSMILTIVLFIFVMLVICGSSMPSFSIETVGLLGLAVESMNEFRDAIVYYSVFDLAKMITDEARYLNTASNYIGLGTLSFLLVLTVFIVPIAQATSLLLEWFRPMDKKQRQRNLVINEILSAWQYMEVYVLSVVIAAWQLGGVSEYMINEYCDSLENLFTALSFYGILEESDAQCFRVNASVENASWLLVAASVILTIATHFVMNASSQMERDQSTPSEHRLHTDRWLTNKETMSLGEEEDEHDTSNEVTIAPVASRFTDLYPFAIKKEVHSEDNNLMLPTDEDASEDETSARVEEQIEIETAKAFWDVPL